MFTGTTWIFSFVFAVYITKTKVIVTEIPTFVRYFIFIQMLILDVSHYILMFTYDKNINCAIYVDSVSLNIAIIHFYP